MIFRRILKSNLFKFSATSTTLLIGITIQKPLFSDYKQSLQVIKILPPTIVTPKQIPIEREANHKFIFNLLKNDWLLFSSILLTTCFSAGVAVYTPIAIGKLVTAIQLLDNINQPALEIATLFIGQAFLTFVDISLVTRLGENLAKR
jgi:hypothetical protein